MCHICQQILVDDNDRVRDHCHFTGTYRGVAHNTCNLNYQLKPKSWKLPVIIHNLKGYDGHLIVKALKNEFGKVTVIPQNIERYLSLSVGRLKFLDSFQFTPKSLDELSKTLENDEKGTPPPIFALSVVKVYTHTITWIVWIALMKPSCHLQMHSSTNFLAIPVLMLTMRMPSASGTNSSAKPWTTTMPSTSNWMSFYLPTSLRSSGKLA